MSSGCFRLTNPELIDLYERVPIGTKVVVRQAAALGMLGAAATGATRRKWLQRPARRRNHVASSTDRPHARLASACCSYASRVGSATAQTLNTVKERGSITCGVSQGVVGFSLQAGDGQWSGFDADFCRALAAAIFNDPTKVTFVPMSASDRFPALQAKRIDVLSRNSTWTMSRELEFGLAFAGVTFYDGQGMMVRHSRKVSSALELDGSKVCVQTGTTTEVNLRDFFKTNGMKLRGRRDRRSPTKARQAYEAGRCDVLTADASALHGDRLRTDRPGRSRHPARAHLQGAARPGGAAGRFPVVQHREVDQFRDARTPRRSASAPKRSTTRSNRSNPEVRRLVGTDGNLGEQLGLTRDWMTRVIRQVGNYADVYDRNIGVKSKLGIPRGINQLWINGGILYAPPIR